MSGELPEQQAEGNSPDSANKGSDAGLVICSKTAREDNEPVFITRARIESALAGLNDRKQCLAPDTGEPIYTLGFSPGSIRVAKSSLERKGKRSENWKPRKAGVIWSDKSRVKMLERFSTLDFSPFDDDLSIVAMLTLTYPSDWKTVAPTSASAKRHLFLLRKRFERQFSRPFFALWKMEFQRRGAPHFHLLAPIPKGGEFKTWLSQTWTEIVNHPDEVERTKHLVAGTGVDKAKGISADTAQRISYYFSKHSSANKGLKEYQNTPPDEWVQAGSVGRFWGYWALDIATSELVVSESDALFVARTLRRWQRANRRIVEREVWRVRQATGELYRRRVRRRTRIVSSSFAFRLIPDGESFARKISDFMGRPSSSL